MRLGSVYVERGESREVRLRLPTLSVWRAPVARTVIWGGSPGRDVWVGSREDAIRERYRLRQAAFRRMGAAVTTVMLTYRDALTPTLATVHMQLAELGRAVERSRLSDFGLSP